jgi:hypothetical protein
VVRDIPIVSSLAKKEKAKEIKTSAAPDMREVDDLNAESHFVENPFIRVRERATKKQLDGKNMLKADNLEDEAEDQDIIMMKEAGKFFIRDLEQTAQDKEEEKAKKRKRADVVGYGDGEEVDSDLDEDENIGNLSRRLKEIRQRK